MIVHLFALALSSVANLLLPVTMLLKNVCAAVTFVTMEEGNGNASSASTDRIHSLSTRKHIKYRNPTLFT